MKVELRFFASLREHLGCERESLLLDDAETRVAAVRALLVARGGNWTALASPRIRAACNQMLADDAAMVRDGDELAFFPPVTGG